MVTNDKLRFHVLNVGHGDCMLVEFPDFDSGYGPIPRFGVVDAGGKLGSAKKKPLEYIRSFLEYRLGDEGDDYRFEFICLTHPHEDHLTGIEPILDHFCEASVPKRLWPRQFWDSGFRFNTTYYLGLLDNLVGKPAVQFVRVSAGTEFRFGDVEILVLGPSIDLRNRYDTYGVELNDASIVLRVTRSRASAIFSADAHFDSWGKISEEFPREKHLTYPKVKRSGKLVLDRRDPDHPDLPIVDRTNQLKCNLLKIAHHGSKRGTTLECIEKLDPKHFVVSCDTPAWYSTQGNWNDQFPHPITRTILREQSGSPLRSADPIPPADRIASKVYLSHEGTSVYTLRKTGEVVRKTLGDARDDMVTASELASVL